MKRLRMVVLTMAMLLLIVTPALAMDWHQLNQSTVGWDAATQLKEGDPIPAGAVVKYRTYIRREGAGENIEHSTTIALEETFTFPPGGKWFVGVQSVLVIEDQEIFEDDITWSDMDDAIRVPVPFGFISYGPLKAVTGLQKK